MSDAFYSRMVAVAALVGTLALTSAAFSTHSYSKTLPQSGAPDERVWLGVSQKAIGNQVGDYRFVEAKGASISLKELRGKPVVVSLVYTSCGHVCPMTTQRLRRAVEEAERVIGAGRFKVITVGFDVRNDTPMRMAAFARAQRINSSGWLFLSGDNASVSKLAEDVGFSYTARAGGFVHPAQTTILDSEGRVYRQVYGDDFPIQMVMEPLKEMVYGTVGTFLSVDGLLDRIRFLCTVYDPNQGRYRFSYAIAITFLTGVISLGATAVVISRAWSNSRRA